MVGPCDLPVCKFTFSDSQMQRQDEVCKDFIRDCACMKGPRMGNGEGWESTQWRREGEKVEAPSLPSSLRNVQESCQGILTKVTYQRGTVTLRVRPILVSPGHLAIRREQPVAGGFSANSVMDCRGRQLGPLVSHTPIVTGLPGACSWPSPPVRLDFLPAPEAASVPQEPGPPCEHVTLLPGPSISQPAPSGQSQDHK